MYANVYVYTGQVTVYKVPEKHRRFIGHPVFVKYLIEELADEIQISVWI